MNLRFTLDLGITKEFLLSKHSEETYMEFYLGIPVKKGLFKSPIRPDNTPTCSFYRNKSGELIFKDFRGDFYGNFVSVVMKIHGCTYYQALKIIAGDFGLIKTNTPPKVINVKESESFKDSGPCSINVEIQDFTKQELDWWGDYGITSKILKKFNVFSCKSVFLNGNYFAMSAQHSPIYGYYGGKQDDLELWRIYFPKRKNYRFITNWDSKKIQGFKQLPKEGKLLCITKSMKDVMCLHSMGIPAIAPNSEHLFISESVLKSLKERFKHIVVLYDNDLAGISNLNKFRKQFPELNYVWIPRKYEAKDISDFYKKYGRSKTIELIKQYLEWLSKHQKRLYRK